jgi:4-amino-4-deoxy-L-arabinose transferase-like glycosyltransferase
VEPNFSKHKSFLILLNIAVLVLVLKSNVVSLRSLDDCFYARKGVEMARSGRFFTVTWNYRANFQNPPLQTWISAQSFRIVGENDFAARLPSILMALGILTFIYLIGSNFGSPLAGSTAAGLLLLTPHFMSNARRCMLEIPTTFWICMTIWFFFRGFHRPKYHALLALPFGAAILTKSVLGLLPLLIFLATALFDIEIRNILKRPMIWIGIVGGLAIGATWPLHQFSIFGAEALREHYFGEIFSRSVRSIPITKMFFGYPAILLTVFQPVILPAIPGFIKMIRERTTTFVILLTWIALPLILYSFSSARSSRYIFPILPALALCGGYWIEAQIPRAASFFVRFITPAILIIAMIVMLISPDKILKDENRLLKAQNLVIRNAVPELEQLPYAGNRYWSIANPLMYYAERQLQPARSMKDAIMSAKTGSGYLVADADRVSEVEHAAPTKTIFSEQDWKLLYLGQSQPKTPPVKSP